VTGPGDVTGPVDAQSGILLRWNVGCGNVHAPHLSVLERLEQTSQDGRMSRDLGFPVAGWRVTSRPRRIKRSYVARVRPTATQLPVYPTRPTGSPVLPTRTVPGWTEPARVTDGDGLQPSAEIPSAPGRGRTTPLPTGRPVVGATTAKSGASGSVSGTANGWLTVASSVLALTVVTLPTVDRTMRRTSDDDENPDGQPRSTTPAKDENSDTETPLSAGNAAEAQGRDVINVCSIYENVL